MKRLKEKAGVCAGKIFPHNLRHLFARIYYNSSKDLAGLADLLGHSSLNVTRIYTSNTEENLPGTAGKNSPFCRYREGLRKIKKYNITFIMLYQYTRIPPILCIFGFYYHNFNIHTLFFQLTSFIFYPFQE